MEKYRKEREEGREKDLLESSTLLVRLMDVFCFDE